MSERKVLNKYYPPDFDASKLPRVKREKNRQFTIRLMAPFNMRCKTCGEYIYRGKKFNARKEDVIGKTYLGIQIYRFYIKCTKCLAEITFLTDPENQDYEMENGAIRNFESIRLAEKQAETDAKQKKEEEENNPMKILENRTRDSKREMAIIETLEDLRELNAANAGVDPKILLDAEEEYKKQLERLQKEEDEEEIKRIFGKKETKNFVEEEIVTNKAAYKKIENKNIRDEEDAEIIEAKKIKIEPDESNKTKKLVLFPKKIITPTPIQSEAGQLKKNNVSSFIKKKPIEIKSEPTENTIQSNSKPNSLLSLINVYSDSEDSD